MTELENINQGLGFHSIQKVEGTCIQGHPYKQKLAYFLAVKGHLA